MPILSSDINSKVRYYSGAPPDKVVRVYTGSYTAGDLTSRVGSLGTIYVYRFAHGLTRPLFCDLLWSTNNATWYDNGMYSAGAHIAFSDSTYVYIFHDYATAGTPIYYKVYATWIDDYDATDPTVTVQNYGDTNTQYDARLNYQKRYSLEEVSVGAGTAGSTSTTALTHDVGAVINAKGWFQPFSGEVWPLNAGGTNNYFLYDGAQDEGYISITSSAVTLKVNRFSNATRRAWVKLQYDGS